MASASKIRTSLACFTDQLQAKTRKKEGTCRCKSQVSGLRRPTSENSTGIEAIRDESHKTANASNFSQIIFETRHFKECGMKGCLPEAELLSIDPATQDHHCKHVSSRLELNTLQSGCTAEAGRHRCLCTLLEMIIITLHRGGIVAHLNPTTMNKSIKLASTALSKDSYQNTGQDTFLGNIDLRTSPYTARSQLR